MIITDEDALVCDMAETYGVFDLYALPAELAATLAVGLRDDSRIKTKLLNMTMPLDDYLLAAIFDCVNWLRWSNTKDAQRGGTPPQSILDILTDQKEEKQEEFLVFTDGNAFEAARARILGE